MIRKQKIIARRKPRGKLRIIVGTNAERKEGLARLRQFAPIVIDLAKNAGEASTQSGEIEEVRAAIDFRLDELLSGLGLNRTEDNVWQRAFLALATLTNGVGTIAVRDPKPSNRNATKWLPADDEFLTNRFNQLKKEGHGTTEALRIIANEPSTWKKLPQPTGPHRVTTTPALRLQTFKKRSQYLRQVKTILSKAIAPHLTEVDIQKVGFEIKLASRSQSASTISDKLDDPSPTA